MFSILTDISCVFSAMRSNKALQTDKGKLSCLFHLQVTPGYFAAELPYQAAMMTLRILALCALSQLQGCSYVVAIVLYNNTPAAIVACNASLMVPACTDLQAGSAASIKLVADHSTEAWQLSIQKDEVRSFYTLSTDAIPDLISSVLCDGVFWKRCNIGVQIENDGRLYWIGKENRFPIENFPDQPDGFPISPTA